MFGNSAAFLIVLLIEYNLVMGLAMNKPLTQRLSIILNAGIDAERRIPGVKGNTPAIVMLVLPRTSWYADIEMKVGFFRRIESPAENRIPSRTNIAFQVRLRSWFNIGIDEQKSHNRVTG